MAHRYFEGHKHAEVYARFRPDFVISVIPTVLEFVKTKATGPWKDAADIGCGSGQSTPCLAPHFSKVTGLDISESQIKEARNQKTPDNVHYGVSTAEQLPFTNESLQLIICSQACHWFDLPKFFQEVDRCLTPGGVLALCAYDFPHPIVPEKSDQLLALIKKNYSEDLGSYWSPKLKILDNRYNDITIPYSDFQRIDCIVHKTERTVKELVLYIQTYSGYQAYAAQHGEEKALKLMNDFQTKFMEILEANSKPEDTILQVEYRPFLLIASKPSS